MPKYEDIDLPTLTLSGDPEKIAAALKDAPMPVEAMIELAVYAQREKRKADAFDAIVSVMRDRIKADYADRTPEQRDTTRTEVGLVTYSEKRTKDVLRDRDWTVENMTDEQIRITYMPDLSAMKTIMKPAEYKRHIKTEDVPPNITIREDKGSDKFTELDF